MKKYFCLILLICFISCDPIKKLYVKFGEEKISLEAKHDSVIRIYFDRQGFIYPDILIPDNTIENSDSRLRYLFQIHKQIFQAACQKHGLAPASTIDQLQLKLIEEKSAMINEIDKDARLIFLIHGYNKHPLKPQGSSAYDEFKLLREKLVSFLAGSKIQFVEIYWDGCSWVNGKRSKENSNSIKIWDNAQAASNLVGLELRRILSTVKTDHSYVVSHSLGASVITCAMFNTDKFNLRYNINPFKQKILDLYADSVNYKTPVSTFTIGMLAPAIPGINTFDEFFERSPKPAVNPVNLSFIVGYNIYDPALIKKIGIPKHFGATSLGCLYSEVDSVEHMLNINRQRIIDDTNFSRRADSSKQKDHALTVYLNNSVPLDIFLRKLFR